MKIEQQLSSLKTYGLPDEGRLNAVRSGVLTFAAMNPQGKALRPIRNFAWRWLVVGVMSLVMVWGGTVTGVKAVEALPGEWAYPVKRLMEAAQLSLVSKNDKEPLKWYLAERRLAELEMAVLKEQVKAQGLAVGEVKAVSFDGKVDQQGFQLIVEGRLNELQKKVITSGQVAALVMVKQQLVPEEKLLPLVDVLKPTVVVEPTKMPVKVLTPTKSVTPILAPSVLPAVSEGQPKGSQQIVSPSPVVSVNAEVNVEVLGVSVDLNTEVFPTPLVETVVETVKKVVKGLPL